MFEKRELKWELGCQRQSHWTIKMLTVFTKSKYLNQRNVFQPISLPTQKQRGRLSWLRGIIAEEIKPKMNSPPLLLEEPQSVFTLKLDVFCLGLAGSIWGKYFEPKQIPHFWCSRFFSSDGNKHGGPTRFISRICRQDKADLKQRESEYQCTTLPGTR